MGSSQCSSVSFQQRSHDRGHLHGREQVCMYYVCLSKLVPNGCAQFHIFIPPLCLYEPFAINVMLALYFQHSLVLLAMFPLWSGQKTRCTLQLL